MSPYRWAMRVGSPLLFWLSILIVVASFLNVYDTLESARAEGLSVEGLQTITRFKLLLSSVSQSLLLGALPFTGALLINRIDRYLASKGAAQ